MLSRFGFGLLNCAHGVITNAVDIMAWMPNYIPEFWLHIYLRFHTLNWMKVYIISIKSLFLPTSGMIVARYRQFPAFFAGECKQPTCLQLSFILNANYIAAIVLAEWFHYQPIRMNGVSVIRHFLEKGNVLRVICQFTEVHCHQLIFFIHTMNNQGRICLVTRRLTHRGRDKMAVIVQKTCSWMTICGCRLRYLLRFYLRFELKYSSIGSDNGAGQATSQYLNQWRPLPIFFHTKLCSWLNINERVSGRLILFCNSDFCY